MKRIAHALVLICLYAVMVFVVSPRLYEWVGPPVGMVIGALVIFGGILWLGLFRAAGLRPRDVGWRFDRLGRDALIGVIGFVGLGAGICVLMWAWQGVAPPEFLAHVARMPMGRRMMALGIGLGAALAEETLYRGYLQPAAGLVPTAIMFSLGHLSFTPLALVSHFWSGLVFGALRGRDRSLVAPATAHVLLWAVFGWM